MDNDGYFDDGGQTTFVGSTSDVYDIRYSDDSHQTYGQYYSGEEENN